MAINNELKKKINSYPGIDRNEKKVVLQLLEGIDEGKQLKRILEPLLNTL